MSITYQCPNCESTRKVSSSMAGRRVRCPDCDEMVEVPNLPDSGSDGATDLAADSLEGDGTPTLEPLPTGADSVEGVPPLTLDSLDGLDDDARGFEDNTAGLTPLSASPSDSEGEAPVPVGLTPVGNDSTAQEEDAAEEITMSTPVAVANAEEPEVPVAASDDGDDFDDDDFDDFDDDDDDDMEEAFESGPPRAEGEMDMTPMVDVTFLLLIFFMVTAAFSLQKSIEIPKPDQTDEPSPNVQEDPEETPDIVTVQIDEYNTFTVLTPDWEKEAPGEMDLLARLRESRQGNADGIIPNQLLVKAHAECLHRRVVMALDAGSETGFDSVQLMTVDGEF